MYAMGQEPWINHISSMRYTDQSRPIVESDKLLKHCASMSICAERLFGEKEILLDAESRTETTSGRGVQGDVMKLS